MTSRPTPKQVADARQVLKQDRKAKRAERGPKVRQERLRDKGGRDAEPKFLRWLHERAAVCIACLLDPAPPDRLKLLGVPNKLEAAHQRIRGWKKGVRGRDADSCILCAWHHQHAPNACDRGWRQFWDRLGVDVAAYCAELYAAYQAGADGAAVIMKHARRAAA